MPAAESRCSASATPFSNDRTSSKAVNFSQCVGSDPAEDCGELCCRPGSRGGGQVIPDVIVPEDPPLPDEGEVVLRGGEQDEEATSDSIEETDEPIENRDNRDIRCGGCHKVFIMAASPFSL